MGRVIVDAENEGGRDVASAPAPSPAEGDGRPADEDSSTSDLAPQSPKPAPTLDELHAEWLRRHPQPEPEPEPEPTPEPTPEPELEPEVPREAPEVAREAPTAIVGYLRVSTDRQAQEGTSLDAQATAVSRWARRRGIPLHSTHRDEGISGSLGLEDRPGLAAAVAAIVNNGADTLVVYSLDRLARSLTVQEAVLATIWRAGGRVVSVREGEITPDDADDPMRTAMRQMMGVFAQLERSMISQRMLAGKQRKQAAGGWAGGGQPYGWRAEGKELVTVPEEQDVISYAKRLSGEGMSVRALAAHLNDLGHRSKRGSIWHAGSVARILTQRPPTTRERHSDVA